MAVKVCICVCVYASCRCSEVSSKPNYVFDDERTQYFTDTDHTARQHRANERSDIFRQFSGSFLAVIVYHALMMMCILMLLLKD